MQWRKISTSPWTLLVGLVAMLIIAGSVSLFYIALDSLNYYLKYPNSSASVGMLEITVLFSLSLGSAAISWRLMQVLRGIVRIALFGEYLGLGLALGAVIAGARELISGQELSAALVYVFFLASLAASGCRAARVQTRVLEKKHWIERGSRQSLS